MKIITTIQYELSTKELYDMIFDKLGIPTKERKEYLIKYNFNSQLDKDKLNGITIKKNINEEIELEDVTAVNKVEESSKELVQAFNCNDSSKTSRCAQRLFIASTLNCKYYDENKDTCNYDYEQSKVECESNSKEEIKLCDVCNCDTKDDSECDNHKYDALLTTCKHYNQASDKCNLLVQGPKQKDIAITESQIGG